MFKFKDKSKINDRAAFANAVLKLIYEKNGGDIDKAIIEAIPFFEYFEEHIRNVYELIDSEIPLYAYYRLKKYGKDNYDFTEEEYTDALTSSKQACKEYYD